jgi:hypothetical protein
VKEVAEGGVVDLVGISTKGPISYVKGMAMIGPCSAYLPFRKQWPFEEQLRQALTDLNVRYEQTQILHDGVAALLGETHAEGTLAGQPNGCAVIWGTGIGLAIREKDAILKGIDKDDSGDDLLRVLGSLGRHLVYRPRLPKPLRYEYRGVPQHHTAAPIEADEAWCSERIAGPWLARRIARDLIVNDPAQRENTLTCMEAHHVDLLGFINQKQRDEGVETCLLAGLTMAALKGDSWARGQIASIGAEAGSALAAFVWAFQHSEAIGNIVLVSSIAERLGFGIKDDDQQEDLLIQSLRAAMVTALAERGMEKQRATDVALGVRRSKLSRERELLAFCI